MGNIMNGLVFTIIGMGIVFTFLVVLVIAINIMKFVTGILEKYFPEQEEALQTDAGDAEIAAVIAAAYAMKNKGV
ncbi:MAG: OadG family protein [Spirochaetia bacterium]|jgi:sodium pump decarboxylase gamma subunit|nr:OadG family protein [Spirochaetia bacterium]